MSIKHLPFEWRCRLSSPFAVTSTIRVYAISRRDWRIPLVVFALYAAPVVQNIVRTFAYSKEDTDISGSTSRSVLS